VDCRGWHEIAPPAYQLLTGAAKQTGIAKALFDFYLISLNKNGGAKRDRTADLLHAMQALSQLSYGPNF
jgi:hypothetical protein